MEKRQIAVVFSFGINGRHNPGKSNDALARATTKIVEDIYPITSIIAQWEIEESKEMRHMPLFTIEKHRETGKYLDLEEVAKQAILNLKGIGLSEKNCEIIVVAQPFLHRWKCMKLFPGFEVTKVKIGWIPFDKNSLQWQTRSPFHLILYTFLQIFFGYKGKPVEELLAENEK